MSGTYREFLDSREGFDAYQPTSDDWAEYAAWVDAQEQSELAAAA